jgi:membrane fusion protein
MAGLAVLTAVSFIAIGVLGTYVNRIRVTGTLVPDSGVVLVRAPHGGRVAAVHAAEGSRVSAGDALVTLRTDTETISREDALSRVDSLLSERLQQLSQVQRAEREMLEKKLTRLREQLATIDMEEALGLRQIDALKDQQDIAEQTVDTYESLANKAYVSPLQVLERKASVAASRADVLDAELQAQARVRARQQVELEVEEAQAAYERVSADLIQQEKGLSQEQLINRRQVGGVMTASGDGVVSARMVEPGQMVSEGDPLVALLPLGSELEAHFFVPSRSVSSIQPGETVIIRFDAFPFERYGHIVGQVVRVSRTTWPKEARVDRREDEVSDASTGAAYRVVVALPVQSIHSESGSSPLLPGMHAEADILLERRRLLDWVLAPAQRSLKTFSTQEEAGNRDEVVR